MSSQIIHKSVSFVVVEEDQHGQRLDNFLLSRLKGLPKSRLYRIVRKGEVRVNKGRVDPSYKLQAGDSIRIPPIRLSEGVEPVKVSDTLGQLLNEAVLYENEALMIIDKPTGLAVHGGSGVTIGLIEALRQVRTDCRFLELAHRLDRDTSGCIVIAKKRSALKQLHTAFRDKTVQKFYNALVVGQWPKGLTFVNAPLQRFTLKSGERMVAVDKQGKASETHFRVLQAFTDYTMIEAKPVTGRTHQIRVHAKSAGYPLCGDVKYGLDSVNATLQAQGMGRLFLHAKSIALPFSDEVITVHSQLPQNWQNFIENLR